MDGYPRRFGPYVLLSPLARGGMGALYLAMSGERGMEKLCVVKTALPHLLGRGYGQRFRDEASVVVRLSHGNLVNVFDAGQIAGEVFIAMDFVEGKDLRAVWNRCAQRGIAFPIDIAVHVVKEISRGLGYVHAFKGLRLVHRDVSPPNVLLSYTGEVKITDFGLAWSTLKLEKTAPGIIFGKVSYMAPEQARGEVLDGRVDLYAAGIILWELLTGRQLFSAQPGKGEDEVLERVRRPEVTAPSKRAARVPQELDRIVLKALAPNAAERYQNGEELRADLAAFLAKTAPATDGHHVARFLRELFGEAITHERLEREQLVAEGSALSIETGVDKKLPAAPGLSKLGAAGPSGADDAERNKTAMLTPSGADGPSRLVGTLLGGRYQIKRLCGEGGMGRVYEAQHVEIGKRVAVKVLHPAYSRTPEVVERFRREARAASRIGHPNIVDVTDSGTTADGSFFFVMEFIEGVELGMVIFKEGPLPVLRALNIAAQMCDALQAAHDAAVIHRDLKPENILLISKEGQQDFVKVLDFGIAKSTEVEETAKTGRRLTRPGVAMGTPEYMAPEQAAGKPAEPRSDIYAVGSILYEMLTAQPPYDGENVMEVLHKKANEAPRLIRELRPDVPLEVEALVNRAMARTLAARPQSMGTLAAEIREVMGALAAEAPQRARTPTPARRESPFLAGTLDAGGGPAALRMSRRTVALLAGALVVLAAFVVVRMATRPGSQAVGPAAGSAAAAPAGLPTTAPPPSLPGSAQPSRQAGTVSIAPGQPGASSEAPVEPEEAPGAELRDEADGSAAGRRAGRFSRTEPPASEKRRLLQEGWRLYGAHRYDDARAAFEKLLDSKPGKDVASAMHLGLAKIAFQQENHAEAVKHARQALRANPTAEAHALLGDAYYRLRRYVEARRAYLSALQMEPENETARQGLRRANRQLE
jgi:eukaryotic-like serine/threonine-protein kinase